MFGSQMKAPQVRSASNSVGSSVASTEHKTCSQKKVIQKDKKTQAQTELIAQQKWEIENLKAIQATRVSPQQLVNAISQTMSCLYDGQ